MSPGIRTTSEVLMGVPVLHWVLAERRRSDCPILEFYNEVAVPF